MIFYIGIPYPSLSDLRVKLKPDFLGKRYKEDKRGYDEQKQYKEEAFIYVNQAL